MMMTMMMVNSMSLLVFVFIITLAACFTHRLYLNK